MEIGSKLYLKNDINVYAKIISKIDVHEIPHFQISIFRGDSISEACVSKHALEMFYQASPHKKINMFKQLLTKIKLH